ncbi:MAG: methyltransferase [Nannocystaceae bacterium]
MADTTSPSPVEGINPNDPGIGLLARAVSDQPAREILLVCGGDLPGVGPEATRLVLDVRELSGSRARAVPLDLETAAQASPRFRHAIVWPRPHLGKDFSVACLAIGALSLLPGGVLWCAARKAKGADSLGDAMAQLMGEVDVEARTKGYRLMRARRTEAFDADAARARVRARYTIEDEALPGLSLRSAPGVFSRRALDAGTRQLIAHASDTVADEPGAVIDLGCGVGPLGLWAAMRWPSCRVLAVDSNLLAVSLARDNVERHGLGSRVEVLASDGLPADPPAAIVPLQGQVDLALVNPPTHADPATLGRMAHDLRTWLSPGGLALLVVSRAGRMTEQLQHAGARVRAQPYPRYTVLQARFARD